MHFRINIPTVNIELFRDWCVSEIYLQAVDLTQKMKAPTIICIQSKNKYLPNGTLAIFLHDYIGLKNDLIPQIRKIIWMD